MEKLSFDAQLQLVVDMLKQMHIRFPDMKIETMIQLMDRLYKSLNE